MKPEPDVCHIWQVPLTAAAVARLPVHLLRDEEIQRAARFRDPRDQERFKGCRSALRAILGECLERSPADIPLKFAEHGRPEVADDDRIQFNVSHSDDLGLIAVAQSAPLGVDVEAIREMKNALPLARRYLTAAESAAVESADDENRVTAYLRCWTRKEALLKSTGHGLTRDTRTVETGPGPTETLLEWPASSGSHVCVRSIDLDPAFRNEFLAACATSAGIRSIEVRLFEGLPR